MWMHDIGPTWVNSPAPVDKHSYLILEIMYGQLTKEILQHLADVQGTIISGNEAKQSWSLSVPKENLDKTMNFFTNKKIAVKK